MTNNSKKHLIFWLSLLFAVASQASAECQKDSFAVGIEYPDGSFITQAASPGLSVGEIAIKLTRSMDITRSVAKDRAQEMLRALSTLKANPLINLAELSAQSGGAGRAFYISHWCRDDVAEDKTPPRTIGYSLREEKRAAIWAKTQN